MRDSAVRQMADMWEGVEQLKLELAEERAERIAGHNALWEALQDLRVEMDLQGAPRPASDHLQGLVAAGADAGGRLPVGQDQDGIEAVVSIRDR